MRMLIAVFIMGQFTESKPFWGSLLNSVNGPVDLLVVDNGDFENIKDKLHQPKYCIDHFISPFWPGEVFYRPQPNNLGVIKSLQYTYENFDHDILAFLHNDVYIYEKGWDTKVKHIFEIEENCGLVGFFGAAGIHQNSGRFHVINNMLEAEVHGSRVDNGRHYEVAVLDGLSMFASREMLAKRDGVDTNFMIHHFYDLDLSLESIDRGYRNFYLSTPIHHQSGMTACRPLFQNWVSEQVGGGEGVIYQNNLMLWRKKWASKLPYQIGDTWND